MQLATQGIAPTADERAYFVRVFAWMSVGLSVTGIVAYTIGRSQHLLNTLFSSGGETVIIVAVVIELLLVVGLVSLVQHMNVFEATAIFLAYAALNGLTISVIFAVYTTKSIFTTFLITAAMFAFLAVWGATTKRDLTAWGSVLLAALFAQVIGVLVNIFWLNSTLYWFTTATGILIFSGLTAYDVQKLKQYELPGEPGSAAVEKAAIVGALALYLDFVNLFLYLLRIFGRRK
jgi:FtsH-binding integral membrane protein